MSFKDKAYDYFDRTIKLLRGSNKMREMMLLSYYYGAEMSFLMNDSRVKEALELAFEREKLIKRLEALPQIPEGYVDGQYSYLYAKLAYIYYVEKRMHRRNNIIKNTCRRKNLIPRMGKCTLFLI